MTEIKDKILLDKPYLQKNYDNLLCEEISSKYVKIFLMHKECTYSATEKKRQLQKLLHKDPFARLTKCPAYLNITGLKIFLMRTNLIFGFYKLKGWLTHETCNT